MKNIVIITHEPLTRNLKRIFYIDEYRSAGFDVAVWDISAITNKGLRLSDQVEDKAIIKVESLSQLNTLLSNNDNKNTLYIPQVPYSWRNREVIKLLSDHQAYCIQIEYYANAYTKTTLKEKLLKLLQFERYAELAKIKFEQKAYKMFCTRHNINIPQKNFTSLALDKTATNYINHPDYESYLDIVEKGLNTTSKPYIVFIDNYFPLHPDLYFHHGLQLDGADKYQQSLKNLFDYLEEKYRIPVIIAAHPKAEYTPETFGNREIKKYMTADLVINSSYVIQHTSNSISYVILANKPLALITTNGYNHVKHLQKLLQKLARLTGINIFNTDNDQYEDFEFRQVEDSIRKEYIETYLHREELGNSRNADILIKAFKNCEID